MTPADRQTLHVEVAYATPDEQYLVQIDLPAGGSVGDAIDAARRIEPGIPRSTTGNSVGIWGRRVGRDAPVADGDRVEIYRPLKLDPREARRRYAAAGMTMAHHPSPGKEGESED